jgi:hypothetical protein
MSGIELDRCNALIACEYSATVRDALRRLGINAWSCDLLPCEGDSQWHIQGNVLDYLGLGWNMMIAHPPCTYLCNSGLRWMYLGGRKENGWDYDRCELMHQAAEFYNTLANAPIPLIAVENPRMHRYAIHECGEPDQYVQLWQFGDLKSKETGFKLKGRRDMSSTKFTGLRQGQKRWRERSRTSPGIANAIAEQWGSFAKHRVTPASRFGIGKSGVGDIKHKRNWAWLSEEKAA